MQTAKNSLLLFFALGVLLIFAPSADAKTLKITSNPSGATVEINGVVVGTTPYEKDFPGGYFSKTVTAFGKRLESQMLACQGGDQ